MIPRQRSTSTAQKPTVPTLMLVLLWVLLGDLTEAQQCPTECSCFGSFISCYQFTESTLSSLPTNADTLVLNGGKISSFPPGFMTRFPNLELLDIQSTHVETVLSGTFFGAWNLDQIAMSDCLLGSIEEGAFTNISAVSQIYFSGSVIGNIRSGAFSELSNIGEFSIWSSQIGKVEREAFKDLSDFNTFAFYQNNVSKVENNAFKDLKNFGKVDVYMNKFAAVAGNAVVPLSAATTNMNMYSNTFPCSCDVMRTFQHQLLSRYRISQKCRTTDTGRLLRLSEADAEEICANEPSTLPTTTPTRTSTPVVAETSKSSTVVIRATHVVSTPSKGSGGGRKTTIDPVFRSSTASAGDVKTTRSASTTGSSTGSGQSHGQTDDSSRPGNGAGLVTQASVVLAMISVITVAVI